MDWHELPGLFPGFPDHARWLPQLQRHAAMIEAAEPQVRVTSVPPTGRIRRHYAESLELARIACEYLAPPGLVVDVGSGGGYPGLVLAILWPGARFALIEPLRKRAALLEEMAGALGLTNVEVLAERAEEAGRGPLRDQADLVTARAVAGLSLLVEYCAPFARAGGLVALAKGSSLEQELAGASRALDELLCTVHGVEAIRPAINSRGGVVLLRKIGETPRRYPRRSGIAAKRPL